MGVHLNDVHIIGVHLTGVHLIGVRFVSAYLMGGHIGAKSSAKSVTNLWGAMVSEGGLRCIAVPARD